MPWQDIVFSIGSWIFVVALLPSIFSKDKPPLSTSIMTGTILVVYAFTYASLDLWMSVASVSAVALAWLTLGVQKILVNRRQMAQHKGPV